MIVILTERNMLLQITTSKIFIDSVPLSNSIFFFYNIPMLEVYISKNTFANKKKPYVFRSRNLITYTQEDIINEIDRSGTTFTAADAAGLLAELEDVFTKFIKSGAAVKLFMGTFRASASGTAETATETFRPKKGRDPRTPVRDHTISLHFEKDQRFSEELRDMKFKRLGFQKLCVPYISVIKNGIIGKTDIFQPGDSVLINQYIEKQSPNRNGPYRRDSIYSLSVPYRLV